MLDRFNDNGAEFTTEVQRMLDDYSLFQKTVEKGDHQTLLKLVQHPDSSRITEDPDLRIFLEMSGILPVGSPSYFEMPITGQRPGLPHNRILFKGVTDNKIEFRVVSVVVIDGATASEIIFVRPGPLYVEDPARMDLLAFAVQYDEVIPANPDNEAPLILDQLRPRSPFEHN